MKDTPETVAGTYQGYQILLGVTAAMYVMAGIFTHVILWIIRGICCLLATAFIIGILVSTDKLKQSGWRKKSFWKRLLIAPLAFLLFWLTVAAIPLIIKSISAGAAVFTMLDLLKPQKQELTIKEETQ